MAEPNGLTGLTGEVKMTVTVTRKATGQVDTYQLTGVPVEEKENQNGCNPHDSGA